jgi:hypothetical protein
VLLEALQVTTLRYSSGSTTALNVVALRYNDESAAALHCSSGSVVARNVVALRYSDGSVVARKAATALPLQRRKRCNDGRSRSKKNCFVLFFLNDSWQVQESSTSCFARGKLKKKVRK